MKDKKVGSNGSYSSMQPVKAVPGSLSKVNNSTRKAPTSVPSGKISGVNSSKRGNFPTQVPTGDCKKINKESGTLQPSTIPSGSLGGVNESKRKASSKIPTGDMSKVNTVDQSWGRKI